MAQVLSYGFCKISKNTFLWNTSEQLLLKRTVEGAHKQNKGVK